MAVDELHGTVMACQLHIIVNQPRDAITISPAVALLDRLESLWSRFLPASDITRINRHAGAFVNVAPETITLVETMKLAWDLTQGRYDPTILPILVANGYRTSRSDPTAATALAPGTCGTGDVAQILVDRTRSAVAIPAGVAIDPGGIGKGLAADMAVALLLAHGARGALVSIGGDLAAAGNAGATNGWRIDIEQINAAVPPLCQTTVDFGGVATSSTRSLRWDDNGQQYHHIIDPATGAQSDTDLAAVTVFSANGWSAEAFATGAILAGSTSVIAYLESHALSGVAITAANKVLRTNDLAGLSLAPIGVS